MFTTNDLLGFIVDINGVIYPLFLPTILIADINAAKISSVIGKF
jgi:hypothetical protein